MPTEQGICPRIVAKTLDSFQLVEASTLQIAPGCSWYLRTQCGLTWLPSEEKNRRCYHDKDAPFGPKGDVSFGPNTGCCGRGNRPEVKVTALALICGGQTGTTFHGTLLISLYGSGGPTEKWGAIWKVGGKEQACVCLVCAVAPTVPLSTWVGRRVCGLVLEATHLALPPTLLSSGITRATGQQP